MDKEKEIEKLCRTMAKYLHNDKVCDTPCEKEGYCHIKTFAEELIKAGYGNVKQAVKEFAECFKAKIENTSMSNLDDYAVAEVFDIIDKLIIELYGADE